MKKAKLPQFFRCYSCSNLIRVGRDYDGGYLVNQDDVLQSDMLISFGINDDWSFEKQFQQLNNCPLLAYDGSVCEKTFLDRFSDQIFKFSHPKLYIYRILKKHELYKDFKNFFSGHRRHVKQFIGIDWEEKQVSLNSIFSFIDSNKIFFKVDIEGSEYRILDTILQQQHRITGLAIEFHDCDLHLERIQKFVSNLKLPIIHVHVNNCSPVDEQGIPHVLEITFSSNASDSLTAQDLPHVLDMPNLESEEEIEISFV